MAQPTLSQSDIDAIGKAFANALRTNAAINRTAPASPSLPGGTNLADAATIVTAKFKSAAAEVTEFTNRATASLDVWRDLTRNGANFSNDIIGMTASASKSRISLDEFASVIKDNNKNFSGLGGSVTRGAEAFAKLSEGFFDSGLTRELKEMGFTSKELNDVLALQITNTRITGKMSDAQARAAYASAKGLAEEMDMTSKLMGKSRELQAEEAKARQVDAQLEAKLKLETIGMGAEDEAKYRAEVHAKLKQAADQGMGQMAKELFVMGTVYTKGAQTQMALSGEAGTKLSLTMDQVRKKQFAAATASMDDTIALAGKNRQSASFLNVAVASQAMGGEVEEATNAI